MDKILTADLYNEPGGTAQSCCSVQLANFGVRHRFEQTVATVPCFEDSALLRTVLGEPDEEQALPGDAQLATELRVSVARLWRRLVRQWGPENPLSIASMAVLGALDRHGELTVSELAAHEHVQPPSMTRTLNNLELAKYVVRAPHPKDGRAVLVSLTARGREQLIEDRRRRDAWLTHRLAELNPSDRYVLVLAFPILEQLSRNNEAEASPA